MHTLTRRPSISALARVLQTVATLFVVFWFWFVQTHFALAAIDNTAIAVGNNGGTVVTSTGSSQSVPVIAATPQMTVDKTGVLNDDDGNPGLTAGDTITYTVEVRNPGNISLSNISINDPLVALTLQSGDADSDNEIDPGEIWIYTGNYDVTTTDLASNGGGDQDIDNTVTVSSMETGDVTDTHETPINPPISLAVNKTGTLVDNGTAGLSAGDTVNYQITATNTGVVDLSNINITDQLAQAAGSTALTPAFVGGDTNSDGLINAGEIWTYETTYIITQANIDDGSDLINTATVTTDLTGPDVGTDTLELDGSLVDAYTMTKIANLVDDDGDGLGDEGETINYTFRFVNTGNRTLTNLRVTDPLDGLLPITCVNDGDGDGDIDSSLPGQTHDCTASYTITTADIASTSGSVDNTATPSANGPDGTSAVTEGGPADDNSTTTPVDTNVELDVNKTVVSATEILPNIVEIIYNVSVENLSSATHSNLEMVDDVSAAISAPASLIGDAEIVSSNGFAGTGTINTTFDGHGNNQLFSGDVQLAPLATGNIRIRAIVDRRSASLDTLNIAAVTTDLISGVQSDDPGQTPGDNTDTNPTPFDSPDADGDGAPDGNESTTSDRDGDGIADAVDYDPTGYFYCQSDGRILTGGSIAVQNVSTGGIQSGLGTSNNITILRDGSDGSYQFYVSAPGEYRLLATLPAGGVASTTHTSGNILDVTSLLPADPGVLGSGEIGNSGILSDFSAIANPFHTEFVFEIGDPVVFNNNIPLELCGTPNLVATKGVASTPVVQPDGTTNLTYRLTAQNDGTERADEISLSDSLDAVFGAGNFSVTNQRIESEPAGLSASINPFYDGVSNVELLTSGGTLQPGESVSVLLQVNVNVPPSDYDNTLTVQGVHPLSGLALTEATATALITVASPNATDGVVATKTTPIDSAPLGARIPYTITFENTNTAPVRGADLVDQPPFGFTYVPGTARVDGVEVEPTLVGTELIWSGQDILPGERTTISLQLQIGAGVTGTEFTNTTFVRDPGTGSLISNIAKATIRLEIEPVFHCSHVIGRVFDDLDQDGYYDIGEPGLGGVRVTTVNGELITTDQFGRYHIACSMVPDDRIGSNFILKLDEKTLPTGYRATSENPRVIRLTRGKLSKINFAAANVRRITLALSDQSFQENSVNLKPESIRDIAGTIPLLEQDRSVLELYYDDKHALKKRRLKAVKKLISKAWKTRNRPYRLEIDIIEKR